MPRLLRTGVVSVTVLCAAACGANGPGASPVTPAAPIAPVGLTVTSVSPTTGSTFGLAEIRVEGTGFLPGATLTLGGVAARVRSVSSTIINAETQPHEPGTVDVVVTNPDSEGRTLPGAYTFRVEVFGLTASSSLVTSGGALTVTWVAPPGRGCIGGGDWIGLYKVGDPDNTGAANGHSDLWYTHLCGATSGTSTLSAPTDPGQYEFRYMVGGTSVARSNPVTVTAVVSTS